jgi:hypothetical protein
MNISIVIAQEEYHFWHVHKLPCDTIESSALLRGNWIQKELLNISWKENEDAAVISLDNGTLLLLLYRKLQDSNYVAHSGLIVHPDYRI